MKELNQLGPGLGVFERWADDMVTFKKYKEMMAEEEFIKDRALRVSNSNQRYWTKKRVPKTRKRSSMMRKRSQSPLSEEEDKITSRNVML